MRDEHGLEMYPDVGAFYDQHEEARYSIESDYGVWWKDDDGGNWRVSYVHATGHVYAIGSGSTMASVLNIGGEAVAIIAAGNLNGPVVVFGRLNIPKSADSHRTPADDVLEGWAVECGKQGSLAWALERVREAST